MIHFLSVEHKQLRETFQGIQEIRHYLPEAIALSSDTKKPIETKRPIM